MKNLLLVIVLGICTTATAQWPKGLPSPSSNGFSRIGYQEIDSGLILANRDTNWVPRLANTIVNWNGVLWRWGGVSWGKLSGVGYEVAGTVGTVFEYNGFQDFNAFVTQGTFSITNGNILIPASSTSILSVDNPTGYDTYTVEMTYKISTGSPVGLGAGIGFKSINAADVSYSIHFDEVSRKIVAWDRYANVQTSGTSVLPAYSTGDIMKISISCVQTTFTVTLYDLTKGTSITRTISSAYDNPGSLSVGHNTANVSIFAPNTANTYEVSSLKYASSMRTGGMLAVGNSIAMGSTTPVATRWGNQIGAQIDAGPGDKALDVLSRIGDILRLKPVTVYLQIGTNDADIDVWKTNLNRIVSILQSAAIRVVILTPLPNNVRSMAAYKNYIVATYPNNYIDLYTPLLGTGTDMNVLYNSGDGVHPNTAGHTLMANTIKASSLYSVDSYSSTTDTSFMVKSLTPTGATPGTYSSVKIQVGKDGRIYKITGDGSGGAPGSDKSVIRNESGTLVGDYNMLFIKEGSQLALQSGPTVGIPRFGSLALRDGSIGAGYDITYKTNRNLTFDALRWTGGVYLPVTYIWMDTTGKFVITNDSTQVNYFKATTYDNASYSQNNFNIFGHHGIGIQGPDLILGDTVPVTRGYIDAQTGTIDMLSMYKVNGVPLMVPSLATLDFPSTPSQTSSEMTVSITGVAAGDVIQVASTVNPANSSWTAYGSGTNTGTVRFNNYSTGTIDPASGSFQLRVIK